MTAQDKLWIVIILFVVILLLDIIFWWFPAIMTAFVLGRWSTQ